MNVAVTCKQKSVQGSSDADAHVGFVLDEIQNRFWHFFQTSVIAATDGKLVVVVALVEGGNNT